ncbi:MAG TPA: hypothetical protein VGQ83_24880 [Polyangia bacterium]|jgi:hypothetical protein
MPVYWKLRRIAPRTLRVLARHRGESQAIAAHEPGLTAKAGAFVAAFDDAMRGAKPAAAAHALQVAVRAWLPILTRDVDGFDATDFGGRAELADDVLDDARRLVERVQGHKDVHGAALPYRDQCVAGLTARIAQAEQEAQTREAADAPLRGLLAALRSTSEALETELQGVRRTLAARLGRQDRDFTKLRPQRAHLVDDDDDPAAPPPPKPVNPAPPGAHLPS